MAFKSFTQYQADKNGEFFVLPNDGDSADVVFLYRGMEDVLVADVHYINTSTYKGYVHCCGDGCPACHHGEKGIRKDTKLFIPLYNLKKDKIEFWDRSTFFEQTLQKYVFGPFPTPWEAVFRVTRHGEANSRDTKYEIVPIGRNTSMSYDAILSRFNMTLPEGYSTICKEMTASDMRAALNSIGAAADLQDYSYTPVPRGESTPDISVPVTQYSAPPETVPPVIVEDTDKPSSPIAVEPLDIPAAVEGDDSSDSLDDVKF